MKKLICVLIFCGFGIVQAQEPAHWNFSAKKIKEDVYEIHLSATIDKPWHIYSQSTPEGGPIPTKINISANPMFTIDTTKKEGGKLVTKYEETFQMNVKYFEDKVDFVKTVHAKPGIKTNVNGSIVYMLCNDHECLPPKSERFSIPIN